MKNRLITSALFILLGGLIAFGPQTIFPVCKVHTTEQSSAQDSGKTGDPQSNPSNDAYMIQSAEDSGAMATKSMVMKCHWTAMAEIGAGLLIALLGVFLLIFRSGLIRLGLSLALILNGILALLIPTVLIGVCGSLHMNCRSLALPTLTILSGIVITASAANVIYLYHTDYRRQAGI
jgi:hypothetical protein